MSIDVRIDRLVIEGVPVGRAERVAADLKARMQERLAAEGAESALGPGTSIPSLTVPPTGSQPIGAQIAAAVTRGLHG